MAQLTVNKKQIAAFCRKHRIHRLSLFGSVLRPDFRPESDVDVLVEFDAENTPGIFGIVSIEKEMISLFGGRRVDLRTPEDLSRYFRQKVIREAEVQYARR